MFYVLQDAVHSSATPQIKHLQVYDDLNDFVSDSGDFMLLRRRVIDVNHQSSQVKKKK
ncbi:hypothetical protein pb186bvf_005661 [Paramecium bursaria]